MRFNRGENMNGGIETKNDGLFIAASIMAAVANGPSNAGCRVDCKICVARGGECRYNDKYYVGGMRDPKGWQMPLADDTCPLHCMYLKDPDEENKSPSKGTIRRVI
jgi:hypothetical protein